MSFEQIILSNLIGRGDQYGRKVIPFLREEYFQLAEDRTIFRAINAYVAQYNRFPTIDALMIDISNMPNVSEQAFNQIKTTASQFDAGQDTDVEWLVDKTEKFCQEKAVYNAIMTSIKIIDGKDPAVHQTKQAIPQILSDALAVSFDTHIGHDWYEDAVDRYKFYHLKEERVPFGLDCLNKITKGGLPKKTLSIILAGVGVGKSLFMCSCAATNLQMGKNVLYITLEMAEERIAERIDANLLDVTVDQLQDLDEQTFIKKVDRVNRRTTGKLVIKEYPTSSAGSANFRHLINELKIKKNFVPDIIYIDYLNICASSRIKYTSSVNSYTYVKAIAEETRGLAVEFDVPIVTATQLTRAGSVASDVGMDDTSECISTDQSIMLRNGIVKSIGDVKVGDQITAHDDYKTVMFVHHKKVKPCVRLVLKSGKSIVVSKDHVFPTSRGRLSVANGLSVGDRVATSKNW